MATIIGDIKVRLLVEKDRMKAELDEVERKAGETRDRMERRNEAESEAAARGSRTDSEAAGGRGAPGAGSGGLAALGRFPVESIISGPISGSLRATEVTGLPVISPAAGKAADFLQTATRFAEFGAPVIRGLAEGATADLPDFMRDAVRDAINTALTPLLDRLNSLTAFERSVSPALQTIIPIAQVGVAAGRTMPPSETLNILEKFRGAYEAQIKLKLRASQLATEQNATAFAQFFAQTFRGGY